MMRIDIVTLFPEMCDNVLSTSIPGRAREKGLVEVHCHQIRDYTKNRQKQTDGYPYGGGPGKVMFAQPIKDCLLQVIREAETEDRPRPRVIFLTAAGKRYDEETAKRLAGYDGIALVCGHYEGIDERVIEDMADEELSIGDYVMTGGELAALVVSDSVIRLQPGVLSSPEGYQEESYWDGLLEFPQYARPAEWEGRKVPEVLTSGDHQKIAAWKKEESIRRTKERRPDLYEKYRSRSEE